MKASDWLVRWLINYGVERVYTLPGGYSMHLNDSFGHSTIKETYMLHESGAAFAAIGDIMYSGKLGVICLTAGPGCMNAMNGVASAWCDGLPLLVISGDVRTPLLASRNKFGLRQGGGQDINIQKIVRPIVKYFGDAGNGDHLAWLLPRVIREIYEPPTGVGWLNIPLDVQGMEVIDG
jgi:acetolactate synthase-1/2/3 large subunit